MKEKEKFKNFTRNDLIRLVLKLIKELETTNKTAKELELQLIEKGGIDVRNIPSKI